MPDLKYLSPALALRYSGHEDYPARATAALDEMFAQVGPYRLDENGLLTSGMLVRHLVLPGQSGEAVRVMQYLATRYGRDILVSAMSQYTPHARACDFPEINRRLRPIEYKRVVAAMRRLGMDNAFTQELDSSDEAYIPPFDLT
jgi:putative pyruvate formate lyase activating enzyme